MTYTFSTHLEYSFFCNGADTAPIERAAEVARIDVAATEVEVEVVDVVGTAGEERTRPVVAGRAMTVEISIEAVARSGEKNSLVIGAFYKIPACTIVIGFPSLVTFIIEFLEFCT